MKKFSCSMETLYTIARKVWASAKLNITDFAKVANYYDVAYCDARIAEVEAAENLPDDQQRGANAEVYKAELKALAVKGRDAWQWLKTYITRSFPELEHKARLEEAGSIAFAKGSGDDWENVKKFMRLGKEFLTNANHTPVFTTANVMPPTFIAPFVALETEIKNKHAQFLSAGSTSQEGTGVKGEANSKVYSKLIDACKDGRRIFKGNDALVKQFTFKYQVGLVDGFGGVGATIIFNGPLAGNEQKYVAVADLSDEAVFDFELPASNAGLVHVALDVNDGSVIDTTPNSVVLNPGQKVSFTFSELLKQGLTVAPTGLKMRNGNGVEVKVVVKTE